jgi:hypothetical protein
MSICAPQPPPQKLRLFDKGWKSDDTKVFDVDRSKGKSTHTHTHTVFIIR